MKDIIIKNAKENNLKSVSLTIPRDKIGGVYWVVRKRQIVACVRHYIRRRSAQIRREFIRLRSAVLGTDGQAGRREYRWSFSRNFDRPKDNFVQPAFYGRHGNGNIRLSPFAVRPYRRAVLSALRIGNNQDDGGSNLRPRYVASSRNQASNTCADSART